MATIRQTTMSMWQLATGQSMGGGIVSYLASGTQRIGVATGMKSPIWPGGSSASQIVVYGILDAPRRTSSTRRAWVPKLYRLCQTPEANGSCDEQSGDGETNPQPRRGEELAER